VLAAGDSRFVRVIGRPLAVPRCSAGDVETGTGDEDGPAADPDKADEAGKSHERKAGFDMKLLEQRGYWLLDADQQINLRFRDVKARLVKSESWNGASAGAGQAREDCPHGWHCASRRACGARLLAYGAWRGLHRTCAPAAQADGGHAPVRLRVWHTAGSRDKGPGLAGISGFFEAGKCNAIMGPSGCGKTTVILVLSGRTPGNSNVYNQEGQNVSLTETRYRWAGRAGRGGRESAGSPGRSCGQ
jgi:ABC-type multidrug transport system fused ATPase/permease subunit